MNKSRKSIDGFVLRPRGDISGETTQKKMRRLDEVAEISRKNAGINEKKIAHIAREKVASKQARSRANFATKSHNAEASFLNSPAPRKVINPEKMKNFARLDEAEESGATPSEAEILQSLAAAEKTPDEPSKLTRRQEKKLAKKLKKQQQTPAKKLGRRKLIKRIILVILLLILLFVGYFGWKFWNVGGKIFGGNPLGVLNKDRLREDQNGRTNVLIFGTSGYEMKESAWEGAFLTDSILVLSVDQDAGDAYIVSLPRDLYVEHQCGVLGTTAGKLNETFYCAYADNNEDEEKGAASLMATAGEILGIDVQYYVHANWTALVQAVDAVGGVTVNIDSLDERGIYDVATELKLPNGDVKLNGKQALTLARARNSKGGYGLPNSNFDREIYQQKIVNALQKKALGLDTLSNPMKVNDLLSAAGDNLRTNIKSSEIRTILDITQKIGDKQIKSLPLTNLPNDEANLVTTGMVGGASVVLPAAGQFNYSEIHAYIRRNIFASPMEKEAAQIDVLNGSKSAGLAQKKAEELKQNYYQIAKVGNFSQGLDSTVQIYQLNQEKTATAEALKKRFNVGIISGAPQNYSTESDFVIIFGGE